jgi:hypothetical protein
MGLPSTLLNLPIPAFYGLQIQDPEQPLIELSHGKLGPDGMAAEFTLTPTNDVDQIIEYLRTNLRETRDIAARSGSGLSLEPHFHTDPYYINLLPVSYGDACSLQVLGCAPDSCVYYSIELPDRPDPRTYPFRTSGGHIHVQVGREILADRAATAYTVAAMDFILGAAATYLCTSKQAYDRKRLYGSAGMIRSNHELGTVEYRTLPAQALIQTEQVARLMFTAAQEVCATMMEVYESSSQPDAIGYFADRFGSYEDIVTSIVPAINAHNVDECRRLQENTANRLSEYATITAVVDKLQRYALPADFDLHWEF